MDNELHSSASTQEAPQLYSVTVASSDNIQIELPGGRNGMPLSDAIRLRDDLAAAIESMQWDGQC